VLITKEQKRAVYSYLLDEGVLVVKKVKEHRETIMKIGRAYEGPSAFGYTKLERNVHNEDAEIQAICHRSLLLELVVLDCYERRSQVLASIPWSRRAGCSKHLQETTKESRRRR
jgi:hypothetical protein